MRQLSIVILLAAILALAGGLRAVTPTYASSFAVTTTADSGAGSVRQVITDANTAGSGAITFTIDPSTDTGCDSSGVCTIQPLSPLPAITVPVTIDGYTQPGAAENTNVAGADNAVLKIQIDGSLVTDSSGNEIPANGLDLQGGNSTVRGLVINRFRFGGNIKLEDNGGDVVAGNFIGTDPTGEHPADQTLSSSDTYYTLDGVWLSNGASNNRIGTEQGGSPADRNVISGNPGADILLGDTPAPGRGYFPTVTGVTGNTIAGNLIGTDASGTASAESATGDRGSDMTCRDGIFLYNGPSNNTIGGVTPLQRNVISAHYAHPGGDCLHLEGSNIELAGNAPNTDSNVIEGNYIGTDVTGTKALQNFNGVFIFDATNTRIGTNGDGVDDAAEGNLISGNFEDVNMGAGDGAGTPGTTVIAGNLIGTDVSGESVLESAYFAVFLRGPVQFGGPVTADRNVIGGCAGYGDLEWGTSTSGLIENNYIGTDATGSQVPLISGSCAGVTLSGTTSGITVRNNVISGAAGNALNLYGTATVQGNLIGPNAQGTALVAGTRPLDGIDIGGNGNVIGGPNPGDGNVIAGVRQNGISINGSNETVQGNWIGLLADGTPLGNPGDGIILGGTGGGTLVGGRQPGDGNVIAFNGWGTATPASVLVYDHTTGNTIAGNSIHDSTVNHRGMGIDLYAPYGPTPNDYGDASTPPDTDVGGDGLQNYPDLATASSSNTGTNVTGTLASTPSTTFTLDFYANDHPDQVSYSTSQGPVTSLLEGQTYLGHADVTTNSTGHVQFTVHVSGIAGLGTYVSSTATGPEGTSEFSHQGVTVVTGIPSPPTISTVDAKPVSGGDPSMGTWIPGGDPVFGGTGGSPGGTIEIDVDGSPSPVCVATVTADGSWTCTPPTGFTWADGPHTLVAVTCDANNSCSDQGTPVSIRVDSTAPTISLSGTCTNGTPTVTVTDEQGGSGVDTGATTYSLDGGAPASTWSRVLGNHTLTVSAADVAGNHVQKTFTLDCQDSTSISSTAATTLVRQGSSVQLSATLVDPYAGTPVGGSSVTLTLGSGGTGQSCVATTGQDGSGTCTITAVTQSLGPQPITDAFAGDDSYLSSTHGQTALIYDDPASGAFVLGDQTVASNPSGDLTFWGSQWWKQNSLSGTPTASGPGAFKGFDDLAPAPTCGSTWTSDSGNSAPPPSSIPSYMAVIVSSTVTQNGSTISGDIKKMVIVKTDTGYSGDPGHPGSGTIVATLCGS